MESPASIRRRTPWVAARRFALRRCWLIGLSGGFLLPARGDIPPVPSAVQTAPQKAALAAVDRVVARYEAVLARDTDLRHQASSRAVLENLKRRRDALHAAFDQSKCDDLRAELILEFQRLAAWVGSPQSLPAAAETTHP